MDIGAARGPGMPASAPDRQDPLRAAAARLEASFLSEMLKAAKVGEPRGGFSGGIGEEQFASMLRERIAQQMTDAGGIGLGQRLFEALKVRDERP